ncbi:hypothetical protein [Streptomyces sp. NRRL S-146]|uniref:hypothetical protein n=1 Tax=Streptomyces sp. NRRL S-146 TaxID=1463884 RepID=UPI0004C5878C|nr:hypothetical protein [Streptomyces sp. NRRL S-146]
MRALTLVDGTATFHLDDRPTNDPDYEPLPYGLTLDQAIAVRARHVEPGDLVVAEFTDKGTTGHIPTPYTSIPHAIADCPCNGCEECDDIDAWTMENHARVADIGWRYVCLSPSEPATEEFEAEPCAIVFSNRPMAVIRAETVASAQAAAEAAQDTKSPVRTYGVMWSADFEASSPQEAARLAYEQLKGYADDAWSPELEVTGEDGQVTVIDLNAGTAANN